MMPKIEASKNESKPVKIGLSITFEPLIYPHDFLKSLILNGKADTATPYSIAEKYCSEAVGLGDDCRLVGYEGAGHAFFNVKWYRQTLLETDRFLTSIGYLPQPAPSQVP